MIHPLKCPLLLLVSVLLLPRKIEPVAAHTDEVVGGKLGRHVICICLGSNSFNTISEYHLTSSFP